MRITYLRDSSDDARTVRRPFHRLLVLAGSLILFAGATQLTAQVVFDSFSSAATAGAALTLSWSHTAGAGSDRLLIVGVSIASTTSVSSVTYGLQSLTLVGAQNGQGSQNRMEMWRLIAPNSGTASVTVTMSSPVALTGGAASFSNVDQTSPLGAFASAVNNNTTPTVVVASAAGELVIDTVAARGDDLFASTGPGQTPIPER